jgi:Rrf2 family protein
MGLAGGLRGVGEGSYTEYGLIWSKLPKMLRLTKKADYALMAVKYLAEHQDVEAASAKDIAAHYHLPLQLLAKILQQLTRTGLLVSHAGTNGGYSLAKGAGDITAFEVIHAIDGPVFITSCETDHGPCDLNGNCTIQEPLRRVNDSIRDVLTGLRIRDLIDETQAEQKRLVQLA